MIEDDIDGESKADFVFKVEIPKIVSDYDKIINSSL